MSHSSTEVTCDACLALWDAVTNVSVSRQGDGSDLFRPIPLYASRGGPKEGGPKGGAEGWGARRVGRPPGFHDSPRAQTCTFEGPGLRKHHQNSTRRHL